MKVAILLESHEMQRSLIGYIQLQDGVFMLAVAKPFRQLIGPLETKAAKEIFCGVDHYNIVRISCLGPKCTRGIIVSTEKEAHNILKSLN